jgi:uncharacterized protein YpmB
MNRKKLWRWVKIIWLIIYIISVTLFVGSIAVMTWLTAANNKAVDNSHIVNYLSLMIGLVSLPGAFIQLIKIVELNKNKEFIATMSCPNCKHKIDLRIHEK